MGADLPGGQSLGIQRKHDGVDIARAALPLLHDRRVEAAHPVPRNLDLHRAAVVGQHRLGARAIAGVPGVLPGWVVLVIAEVVGHLFIQRGLDHRLGQRLEQPARTGQRGPALASGPHQLAGHLQLLGRRSRERLRQLPLVVVVALLLRRFGRLHRCRHVRQCLGHHRPFLPTQPSWRVEPFTPKFRQSRLGRGSLIRVWMSAIVDLCLVLQCSPMPSGAGSSR